VIEVYSDGIIPEEYRRDCVEQVAILRFEFATPSLTSSRVLGILWLTVAAEATKWLTLKPITLETPNRGIQSVESGKIALIDLWFRGFSTAFSAGPDIDSQLSR